MAKYQQLLQLGEGYMGSVLLFLLFCKFEHFKKFGGKPSFDHSLTLWQNFLKMSMFGVSWSLRPTISWTYSYQGFASTTAGKRFFSRLPMISTLQNPMIVSQFSSLFYFCSTLYCWALSTLKYFPASRILAWFFFYYFRCFLLFSSPGALNFSDL